MWPARCAAQSASSPCARDGPTDGGETSWRLRRGSRPGTYHVGLHPANLLRRKAEPKKSASARREPNLRPRRHPLQEHRLQERSCQNHGREDLFLQEQQNAEGARQNRGRLLQEHREEEGPHQNCGHENLLLQEQLREEGTRQNWWRRTCVDLQLPRGVAAQSKRPSCYRAKLSTATDLCQTFWEYTTRSGSVRARRDGIQGAGTRMGSHRKTECGEETHTGLLLEGQRYAAPSEENAGTVGRLA